MKSIYFCLPIFVIHLASLDEWWDQEEKTLLLVNTARVCEAAWLKGSLPAETLQHAFTLEISRWSNGLLLATLTAAPWSLSVRAVDRQLSMLTGTAQVLVSVLSPVCHQVSVEVDRLPCVISPPSNQV